MIGGWAIVNGADFASYSATQGVGAIGSGALPAYSPVRLRPSVPTDNVSVTATVPTSWRRTVNSACDSRSRHATAYVNLNTATDVLTLGSGGLLINDSGNHGVYISGGILTAGTSSVPASLYVFANTSGNTQTSTARSPITLPRFRVVRQERPRQPDVVRPTHDGHHDRLGPGQHHARRAQASQVVRRRSHRRRQRDRRRRFGHFLSPATRSRCPWHNRLVAAGNPGFTSFPAA